jgi:tRNA modification GTPase
MKDLSTASTDTIVALSTPMGYSGVGAIRISGPESVTILRRVFLPLSGANDFPDRMAVYGKFIRPDGGAALDDGIAVVMRGPHSYTGEDTVEITLHGSPVVLDLAVRIIIGFGARLARRGEFTRRAFLSGKLDLIQAESVIDLIEAGSPTAATEARAGIDKGLTREVCNISNVLKDLLSTLEAHIDFDEDDLEPAPEIAEPLNRLRSSVEDLVRRGAFSRVRRQGVKTVIAGKPNVGKSTLFNALLRSERMIVTPFPGATRDFVEEPLLMDDICFLLTDTAGIRDGSDPVEAEGIRRTRGRVDDADLIMMVIDGSLPLTDDDIQVFQACSDKRTIIVVNKTDLPQDSGTNHAIPLKNAEAIIRVSAKQGIGIHELEERLLSIGRELIGSNDKAGLNRRCFLLLEAMSETLRNLDEYLRSSSPIHTELVSMELRTALGYLEEMTGERIDEGILERIFERFCVGK